MSIGNTEMYRKVSEFYRELKEDGAYYSSFEALEYMYQAALEKMENQSKVIGEIDNDYVADILTKSFSNYGIKFVKPEDNRVLPTIRIIVTGNKYLKEDSSISLSDDFYRELRTILVRLKINDIQWNNNRTSFWWNPKK
jgi:hypothetical protein